MEIYEKGLTKKKKLFLLLAGCILIILISQFNIMKLDNLNILNDEFGYWNNALTLKGFNWSELGARTPHYGIGYSLILYLISFIPCNPSIWYKIAIGLNSVFLVFSFLGIYKIGKLIFKKLSDFSLIILAFILTTLPQNICYAQYTWVECLLFLLYIYATYFLLKYHYEKRVLYVFIYLLLLSFLFLVHARNIFVFLFGGFILVVDALIEKRIKNGVLYFTFVIISFFAVKGLEQWQLQILHEGQKVMNVISLDGGTFSYYFSLLLSDPKLFIISLIGKIDYLLLISGFTALLPYFLYIKKVIKSKNIFSLKYWWILGVPILMIILTTFRTVDWLNRKDSIVYTRYFDYSLAPLLLIGLGEVIGKEKKNFRFIVISSFFYFFTVSYVVSKIYIAHSFFNVVCSPVFGFLYQQFYGQNYLALVCEGIGFVFLIFYAISIWGKRNKILQQIIWISISIFSLLFSYFLISNLTLEREAVENEVNSIYQKVEELEFSSIGIYSENSDGYVRNAKFIQFREPELKFKVYDSLSKEESPEAWLISGIDKEELMKKKWFKKEYELVEENSLGSLYVLKDGLEK